MSTDTDIETLIQSKNLNAPRVTKESIEEIIRGEGYFLAVEGLDFGPRSLVSLAPGTDTRFFRQAMSLLTICVLYLENGFTVIGESACASPENFDAEVGRKAARTNAVNKLWPLEGYRLKQRLYEEKTKGSTLVLNVNDALSEAQLAQLKETFRALPATQRDNIVREFST